MTKIVEKREGVSGPKAKSLEKVSKKSLENLGPKSPKKVSKKVQKVSKNPFQTFVFTFRTFFETFFGLLGARPRETFFETFSRLFGFPRLLLPGPRNLKTRVNQQFSGICLYFLFISLPCMWGLGSQSDSPAMASGWPVGPTLMFSGLPAGFA